MTPWEAVSDRFGMDESDFREMHDEQRELLAFWVEGSDVGGRSCRGVDFWNAGGIDDVVALNADFAAAVAECLEADQVAGRDAGPFDETLERLREDWVDSGHVDIDAQGVMHPADKCEKSQLEIDDYVQVKSLASLLEVVVLRQIHLAGAASRGRRRRPLRLSVDHHVRLGRRAGAGPRLHREADGEGSEGHQGVEGEGVAHSHRWLGNVRRRGSAEGH